MTLPKEIEFKKNLAQELQNPPYAHDIYFSEGKERKFRIKGTRKRVDLLMYTNPLWEYHPQWPYIGIETKIAVDLGWIVKAISQCKSYSSLRTATYFIDEKEIDPPELTLLVTNESWASGQIYHWNDPRVYHNDERYRDGWWQGITEIFDRILWKSRTAILRNGRFLYRQKWYDLTAGTTPNLLPDHNE